MWTSVVFFAAGTWFGFFIVALMQAGKDGETHAGRCGEQNDQLRHQHHQADGPDDDIGEESYLVGPMVFFRIDRDGCTVSLQVADLYQLAEFLEEHSIILMQGGESFIAIRLD